MNARTSVAVLVTALAVVATSLWLRSRDAESARRPRSSVGSDEREDAGPRVVDPASQARRAVDAASEHAATAATKSSQAPPAAGSKRGRIVVFDARGGAYPACDGSFQITPSGGRSRKVIVRAGSFETEAFALPGCERSELVLAGQSARFEPLEPGAAEGDDAPLEWRAQWDVRGLLRVVDRDSGVDLSDVRVLAAVSVFEADTPYPNASTAESGSIVLAAQSPFAMPAGVAARTLWVGAPGHAWKRTTQLVQDVEQTVRLERGGNLRVRTPGRALWRGLHFVRVYRNAELFGARLLQHDADARFDGLPLGSYRVQLEIGPHGRAQTVLAAREVSLVGSVETTLEFQAEDIRTEPTAVLLTLRTPVPEAFGGSHSVLARHVAAEVPAFELGASRFNSTSSATLQAEIPTLQPGEWEFEVRPWGIRERVVAEPGKTTALEIALPTLARVRLTVLDQSNERALTPTFLTWRPLSSDGSAESAEFWSSEAVRPDGVFEFWACAGRIEAEIFEQGYSSQPQAFDIRAGANELVLSAAREETHPVEVTLVDGGARVPLELGRWEGFRLRASGHEGKQVQLSFARVVLGTSLESSRADLLVDAPGAYVLDVGEVPGYQFTTVPPFEVHVLPDALTRVELEVRPEDGAEILRLLEK